MASKSALCCRLSLVNFASKFSASSRRFTNHKSVNINASVHNLARAYSRLIEALQLFQTHIEVGTLLQSLQR